MSFRLSHLESDTEPHSDAIMYGPIMMSGIIESIGEISPILTNSNIGQSKDNKIKNELFYSGDSIFIFDFTFLAMLLAISFSSSVKIPFLYRTTF